MINMTVLCTGTIDRSEVCVQTDKEDIYPFPSFEKNFLDSVDFCNILKGTIPVPRSERIMSDINEACDGSPYTGHTFTTILLILVTVWRKKNEHLFIFGLQSVKCSATYMQRDLLEEANPTM